jgi:hypothetical protein
MTKQKPSSLAIPTGPLGLIAYSLKTLLILTFLVINIFGLNLFLVELFPEREQLAIFAPTVSSLVLLLLLMKALYIRTDFFQELLDNGVARTSRIRTETAEH